MVTAWRKYSCTGQGGVYIFDTIRRMPIRLAISIVCVTGIASQAKAQDMGAHPVAALPAGQSGEQTNDPIARDTLRVPAYVMPEQESAGARDALNARLAAFRALPPAEQADAINDRAAYAPGDKPFLLSVVSDKAFTPHVRNEVADLLRMPMFRDESMWRLYVSMVEDESESTINRNYAIQYLAHTFEFASDPAAVEHKLYTYSKLDTESLGSTALLQLYQLYLHKKVDALRPGFADRAAKLADDTDAAHEDRVTAVCILAETAKPCHLPLLRRYASQDGDAALKRTAIAALGERGTAADEALINAAVDHPHMAVRLAARQARKRFQERAIAVARAAGEGE